MFNTDKLETTEFYQHRFKNFSTRLIIPSVIALVIALIFVFVAKREVTISTSGELTPVHQAISVQSTTASRIIENHLKEGRFVTKGDTLLTYHDVNNPTQLKVLESQIKQLQAQETALDQFKQGLSNNQDPFTQDDPFGYRQALKDYLSQRQIYALDSQQVSGQQATDNNKVAKVNQLLQQNITSATQNITAYQALSTAIQNQSGYQNSQPYSYLYRSFTTESKDLTGADLDKVKSTYISQIDEKIDAEKTQLDSLKLQQANNEASDTSQQQLAENDQKMAALQASQLKSVADQKNQTTQSITELNGKVTILKDQTTDVTVKAPATGTLHLDNSLQGKQYLPSGATLAEIYPVIKHQKQVRLTLAVSPTEITSVKLGQKVRLQIARNVPVPLILTGIVSSIDTAPTVTKNGNLFMVTANVAINQQQARSLHYGLSGKVSIITGKKTYFNFWKDRLFNQD